MEYRYIPSKVDRRAVAEEIKSITDERLKEKLSSSEPLVIQFLSLFKSDFYPYNSNRRINYTSTVLYELISECTQSKSIVQIWEQMRAWHISASGKYEPSTYKRKAMSMLESLNLRVSIMEWSLEKDWSQWNKQKLLPVGPLCILIANSDTFVECVRQYLLDAGNGFQEWDEYYREIGRITQPLSSELRRIELFYSFLLKFYVSADKIDYHEVANRLCTFCDVYLQIDLPSMQGNQMLDQIRMLADSITDEEPVLKDPFLHFTKNGIRSAQDPIVSRNYYITHRKELLLQSARALQQCYNRAFDNLLLTKEQDDALKQLNILFPDDSKTEIDLGISLRSYRYLFGVEETFAELDVLVNDNSNDYYCFSSYLEAACLSFWNLIKFELPLRICNHCNRFFIPKQNRSSQKIYCHRKSLENSDWVCSQYHSHFVSRYKGSDNFKKFDNKIGALRSKLTRGNKSGYVGVPIKDSDEKQSAALLPVTTFILIALIVIRENARNDVDDLNLSFNFVMVDALAKIYEYVKKNPSSIIPTQIMPADLNSFTKTYEACIDIIEVAFESMMEGK